MKKLNQFITEKLAINNNTNKHHLTYDLDNVIDDIIEYLSYEIDDSKEGMRIDGEDLYLTKGLRIGIDISTGEWKVAKENEIKNKFDLVFNPEELTCIEYETFVTSDLEEKIRSSFSQMGLTESKSEWEGFNLTHERYEASIENGKLLITCNGKNVISLDNKKTKEFTDWVESEQKSSKLSKEDAFIKLMMVLILPF